ncbi:MAG: hypothetical protein HQ567_05370 [Candidatus Nealsonbacteria bacterium]|nr:hypothetical protein [Candidatus Nealsonbacteria bacterium]
MDFLGESPLPVALALVGMSMIIVILLRRSHRYLRRQKRSNASSVRTEQPSSKRRHSNLDAPADVLRWEVQMHETARELSATLDSKMRALQALIAEADRAAGRLEAATEDAPEAGESRPLDADEPRSNVADRGQVREHQEEIYTLADYGLDVGRIASRVGMPVGEVQLILGLRGQPGD